MKSYNIKQKVKVFVLMGTAILAGCTNLDETIYSSYTDENSIFSQAVCVNDWPDLCGSPEVI